MFSITCKECGFSVDVTTDNVQEIICQPSWGSRNITDRFKEFAIRDNLIFAYSVNDDDECCGLVCKCGNEV